MDSYSITKDDIKKRIYFITKLVQNQNGSTMQGALTSKSDSMGGIFDRFINTLSDSIAFDEIIFKKSEFKAIGKKIKAVEDFYYYRPNEKAAGIAPDIFGVSVDGKIFPFTVFDNKWKPVKNTPKIEVKTFKAKDQMISLRNQHYDDEYLVLVDLDLRIDYLVPFLNEKLLNKKVLSDMKMNDSLFIKNDKNNLISRVSPIDFSNNKIGDISLINITNASNFMKQSTLCEGNISVLRMKEIKKRCVNIKKDLIHEKLTSYANPSPRISKLYEFNKKWYKKNKIGNKVRCLDFAAHNISNIEIIKFTKKGIVINPLKPGCSFNGEKLTVGNQYTVCFETLNRSGNGGSEYFLQKQCASYLKSSEKQLIKEVIAVIK